MPQRETALYIIERLRQSGFEAYMAGGCVRDKLLGREPKDYDIATNARPEAVQRIFPRTVPVGSQFGVVMVMLEGESLEVATFRFDGPYLDGRHPSQVRFGSMEEDIMRRDFTINGMMYDPTRDRVIDLVEGAKDIKRRVIRAIGDARRRFEEDHLRMLRAVRIAAGLDFTIDENTLQAIQEQAAMIARIAWERIGKEITRLLTEGGARKGFDLLDATGLLPVLLPEVEATKGVEQSPDFHPEGDVYVHTLATLEYLKDPTETLAYGCLLHDIAKPACFKREGERISFIGHCEKGAEMAVEVLKRLKRSRAVWERVAYLVGNHLKYTQAPNMRLSTLKKFLREDGFEELLELSRVDSLSSKGDLRYYNFCKQRLADFKHEEIHPEPLVRGRDLIALGFSPGPLFQTILKQIEEAQLNGEIIDKDQALEWILTQHGNARNSLS